MLTNDINQSRNETQRVRLGSVRFGSGRYALAVEILTITPYVFVQVITAVTRLRLYHTKMNE